mmetsp:Transcript_47763/g.138040  ORF Transcript_47763/g.138040 Transcript_47763/m.138040 type:complete len:226 (+) Transcript_47763:3046-3723(+)
MGRLERLQFFRILGLRGVMLRMGAAETLEVPALGLRGRQQRLQPLGQRSMLGPQALEVAGVPVMCVTEALELPGMPVHRVVHQLVHLAQAIHHHRMGSFELLQIPGMLLVLVRRITGQLLQIFHTISDGGVCLKTLGELAMGQPEALTEFLLVVLQAFYLHSQGLELAEEGGMLLPNELQLALVEFNLLLVQGLDLPLPLSVTPHNLRPLCHGISADKQPEHIRG